MKKKPVTRVGRTTAPPLSGLSDYARDARELALAPYSSFRVGAALLTVEGEIITGCNVESATYGLTLCAERIAVFKAVSEGFRNFSAIAVVADAHTVTPPCGACRQVLFEFGADMAVIRANLAGERVDAVMRDLLPDGFDGKSLDF